MRPWLLTIAHNLKRDHLRRRQRWRLTELEDDTPEERPARDEGDRLDEERDALRLRDALAQISADQRQVIGLHWFGGASFPEVASVLGLSVSAAKVRAHRGYERLREILGKDRGTKT